MKYFTVLFLGVFLLLACGESQDSGSPAAEKEKVFIFGYKAELVTLDPPSQNDTPSALVLKQLYSSLFRLNEQLEIVGDLCLEYRVINDLTWQFDLRPGIKFHNGTDLTAEDVVFSLTRAFEQSMSSGTFSFCDRAEVVDSDTLNIITTQPYAPLLNKLTHTHASVYPKAYFEEVGSDGLAQKPVGSGPFVFDKLITGDRIELVAFDDYFAGRPKIDRAVIRVIPEASAMTIALETGEIHATRELAPNDVGKVMENPQLTAEITEAASFNYLGFNTRMEPFSDPGLRRALSYAINRDDIVAVAGEGFGTPARGFLPMKSIGALEFEQCSYQPDKAKTLLEEAGYSDLSFTVWTNDNKTRRDMAQVVQANFAEIGVKMDIEILEWGSFLNRLTLGEHEAFILGWISDGEPDGMLYRIWHSTDVENGKVGSNFSFNNDPLLDELLERGATTIGAKAREPIYQQANRRLVEIMPVLPGWWRSTNLCYSNKVVDFHVHPTTSYIFDKLDIVE